MMSDSQIIVQAGKKYTLGINLKRLDQARGARIPPAGTLPLFYVNAPIN